MEGSNRDRHGRFGRFFLSALMLNYVLDGHRGYEIWIGAYLYDKPETLLTLS